MDKNKDHIINLKNIDKFKNIGMVELHETLLHTMHMKGEKWIIKVTFVVEY